MSDFAGSGASIGSDGLELGIDLSLEQLLDLQHVTELFFVVGNLPTEEVVFQDFKYCRSLARVFGQHFLH